ncbi:MAG TPA: MlaD family protein, partial [Puia sp.]|nr:MlaD family protein [Puia sp.]
QAGANVWFEGMKVGTVKRLSFDGRRHVRVEMDVDRSAGQYIPMNANASVGLDGLIGNRIVVLRGRGENAPPIADGAVLPGGRQEGSDMLGTLGESSRNLVKITEDLREVARKIDTGGGTVGRLINDGSLAAGMQRLVNRMNQAAVDLQQSSADIRTFSAGLNNKSGLTARLVNDTTLFSSLLATAATINEAAGRASAAMDTAYRALGALNDTSRPVGMLLGDRETAADLRATIANLRKSSVELSEDLEALQHNFLLRGFFRKKQKK